MIVSDCLLPDHSPLYTSLSPWPQCSAQCGPGVQKREVLCLSHGQKDGGDGEDCLGEKPADMKACNRGACETTTMWYSSPWTQVGTREYHFKKF